MMLSEQEVGGGRGREGAFAGRENSNLHYKNPIQVILQGQNEVCKRRLLC